MKGRVITIAILLLMMFGVAAGQQIPNPTAKAPSDDLEQPQFRYVIIAGVSKAEKYANRGPHYYIMDVLMEDKAFNEKNLTLLFRLLSRRFSDRPGLFINVYTSLDAIRTPEEYDATDLAGPRDDYHKYKFAFFLRNASGESYRYGIPNVIDSAQVQISDSVKKP